MTIGALIDKEDAFEIVRDKLGLILATESAAQQALATAGGEDPDLWKLRVYIERSNPWEAFRGAPSDRSPIVNVRVDNIDFPKSKGNVVSRQEATTTYNIDVYGLGVSADVIAGGHTPGDSGAALTVHRGVRLVRNILMAAHYVYLDLEYTNGDRVVSGRWMRTIPMYQPQIDNRAIEQVYAARLALDVSFNEYSPQVTDEHDVLELISVDVKRTGDGQIIAEADFDYSTP